MHNHTHMPTCVIVDDHTDTREGFAEYLEVNGFEVLTAASAEEFETVIAARTVDAIVLDLQLPGLDGWELARRIRERPALRDLPLVAFSARVMPDDRERAEEAGFDQFLAKPCDPDVLLEELHRLIAARRGRPPGG